MNAQPAASAASPMDALLAAMGEHQLAPLWQVYERIVLREPQDTEVSRHWPWSVLEPLVRLAEAAVTGEHADHRVLLLTHPAFNGRIATTSNLLAGIQCVRPGEQTIAHRHTASAVRFVIESDGAETYVDGKTCPMRPGDVILTPNWTWHAHANPTQSRAVWVDMLDVPMMGLLRSTFGGRGPVADYPRSAVTLNDAAYASGGLAPVTDLASTPWSPRVHWSWSEVSKVLEHTPARSDGSRLLRYTNLLNGGAVLPTIDIYALEVASARATARARSSGTALCVVVEGEGESRIGDVTHRWQRNDVFTLPHWTYHSHRAANGAARLLIVSDHEAYRRLGLLREQIDQ